MTRDVSSWFVERSQSAAAVLINRFTIAGSDYSSRVLSWPSFSRRWNDIRPRELSINLSNADGGFNFLRQNPATLTSSCALETGFATEGGYLLTEDGDLLLTEDNLPIEIYLQTEYITLLNGTLRRVSYQDAKATVSMVDKFIGLSNRIVGTDKVPVDFTGSEHLASDLAWYICTSYGGLDATKSTDNPDIDYTSFLEWSAVMSANNIRMSGYYAGEACTQVLKSIGELTYSAIFDEEGRIKFKRFSVADSSSNTFEDANLKSMSLAMDLQRMRNRQYVSGAYDVTSKDFDITVTYENSGSVASYGPQEDILADKRTWLVNSASCIDLAQRMVTVRGEPYNDAQLNTTYYGLKNSVGDTITAVDSSAAFSDNFRILGFTIEPNVGTINMELSQAQLLTGFTLDTSVLDGPDVLA